MLRLKYTLKKFRWPLTFLALVATIAMAAGYERISHDKLLLGTGSSADKVIEFDQDQGANNAKITIDSAQKFGFNTNIVSPTLETPNLTGGSISDADISGGTASDIHRITLPADTKANLDALTRKAGTAVYATDLKKMFIDDGTLLNQVGSGAGQDSLRSLNIVENPGFEKDTLNWTASGGTFTATTTPADIYAGDKAGEWDCSGVQTLTGDQITIPAGFYGDSCYLFIQQKDGDANYTLEAFDGTSAVASRGLTTQSGYTDVGFIFQCPSSGTIAPRISCAANAAPIHVDQVFLGVLPDKGEVVNPIVKTITGTVGSVGSAGQISAGHVLGSSSFNFTPADDLAYWHLSSDATDNSGVTACSSGAAACDLTNNGSVPFTGTDLFGATGAATLNGTSQDFSSTDAYFNPGPGVSWSMGGWFAATDWTPAGSQAMMGNWNGNSDRGFELVLVSSGDIVFHSTNTATADDFSKNFTPPAFVDGSQHHFVVVFDFTAQKLLLYVDGLLADSITATNTRSLTSSIFRIGAEQATAAAFFAGTVQQAFFTRKALSSEDARKLYSYKQPLNLTIGPESQEWLGLWSRSDGQVKNQLENGWLVDKRSDEVFWDLSSLDPSDSVDLKLKQLSFNANTLSSATYDSGVLSVAPTFPLAHGLPGRPLSVTLWVEGATTAGTFDPRTDLCSTDATNLTCDLSSLTIDGTHRIEITASMTPGGNAVRCADGTSNGLLCIGDAGQNATSASAGLTKLNLWQRKDDATTTTSTGVITALSFSNLTIGKIYRATFVGFLGKNTSDTNNSNVAVEIKNGVTSEKTIQLLTQTGTDSYRVVFHLHGSVIFTATDTSVTFDVTTFTGAASYIVDKTSILEELNNYVETSAW